MQFLTLASTTFSEPNSFHHVFNVTIPATELAKDYDHLRQLLDEAGYDDSILVGPEVNHIGDLSEMGDQYAKTFLSSQKNTVNYVTWHQYYLNGREAKVMDFVNPAVFNLLPAQINSLKQFIAESGKDVPMWLCMCIYVLKIAVLPIFKSILSFFFKRYSSFAQSF